MSGNEKREKKVEKLQLMVADSELEAIDDWRFENRASSRSNAMRTLIFLGLQYWSKDRDQAEKDIQNADVD